jgi:hypothetical protein
MDNSSLTAVVQQNIINSSQEIIATVICDSFNAGILTYGLWQMYLGIEVGHPVYATLFNNLLFLLFVSIIEIILTPFLNQIRVETLIKSFSGFCALFHASTWLVMSALRYIYIVHSDWVHKTFPEARTLTIMSIAAIYSIYGISMSIVISTLIMNGWPQLAVTEMDRESKIACMMSLLACYVFIFCVSNIFFVLILHERGAIGKNGVGVLPAVMETRLVSGSLWPVL